MLATGAVVASPGGIWSVASGRASRAASRYPVPDSLAVHAGLAGPLLTVPPGHPFVRPGLLNDRVELAFVANQVKAGRDPWHKAWVNLGRWRDRVNPDSYAAVAVVDGRVNQPDFDRRSSEAEARAAHVAYADALAYVITGQRTFADSCLQVLNDWGATLRGHVGLNRGLQAGWVAPVFCRAADLLHGYATDRDLSALRRMLTTVMLPLVVDGAPCTAGNWELSHAEATLSIGVVTEDVEVFNRGLYLIQRRIPWYFYVREDGPTPIAPSGDPAARYGAWETQAFARYQTEAGVRRYWYRTEDDTGPFYHGQCQETCRDLLHAQMGAAAAVNCMQIALHQGVDLFTPHEPRLTAAMEQCAGFLLGEPIPADLRRGVLKDADKREPAWELAHTHYAVRRRLPLPRTAQVVAEHRARPLGPKLHMAFETLTHADLPRH